MNTNVANLRKTTGRLYWTPTGEVGAIDFGNCTSHKVMPEVGRVDHFKHADGVKRVDMSLPNTVKPRRVFTFDEHLGERLRLLHFAAPATEVTQAAAVGLTKVFPFASLAVGRTYDLGRQSIGACVITKGAPIAALVPGLDYVLDAGSGLWTLINNRYLDGTDFTAEFDCAEVVTLNFEMFSRLLEQGGFTFVETDQLEAVPGSRESLTGTVYVTAWGDGDSEKFQEYTVEVLEI
jgi:hypothetical protein